MLIVDAHEDLAWNMLTFGRDYTRSAEQTRQLEKGGIAPIQNGDTLLGWEDYQRGQVCLVFASLFAAPERRQLGEWDTQVYRNAEQAFQRYDAQQDAYQRLVDEQSEKFQIITSKQALELHLENWQDPTHEEHPVGLVLMMEGAEAIRQPQELEIWWQQGVRIIGPAWASNRFCGGTGEPGPLTTEGFDLLEGMAQLGFILDISHMDEKAVLQSLDTYPRVIIATHANSLALLKDAESNRFLSDKVLNHLIERGGIVGVVPFNRFLLWGWSPSDGRQSVSLDRMVAQIDYICQIAGDAHHVGIGSDFDGGFGLQMVPGEINTIADLRKLIPLLAEKGYTENNIADILGGNWLALLRRALPEGK